MNRRYPRRHPAPRARDGAGRRARGVAVPACLAGACAPHATVRLVQAADTRPADVPKSPPKAAEASPDGAAAAADAEPDAAEAPGAAKRGDGTDITIDRHGIRVEKGRKHVTVDGLGADREYDSFEQFVQDAPWLAGLVFLVVLLVFLVPLLTVVLLIWYKLRKNRMLNETMLKLAEKGVVPPAEALAALDANRAQAAPAAAPMYDLAKQIRQRTVASDLRKGVILIAVGLAFVFYWMLGEGEPSWLGLILLFLGIGYCVLWYLEDRLGRRRQTPPGAARRRRSHLGCET